MILPHSLWLTNVNSQVLATVGSLSHEQKTTQNTRSSNDWGKGLTYEGVRESWNKQGNHKVSSSWLYINFYSLKNYGYMFSFEIYVFFELMLLIKLKKKKKGKQKKNVLTACGFFHSFEFSTSRYWFLFISMHALNVIYRNCNSIHLFPSLLSNGYDCDSCWEAERAVGS